MTKKEDEDKAKSLQEEEALTARRARLRSSLLKPTAQVTKAADISQLEVAKEVEAKSIKKTGSAPGVLENISVPESSVLLNSIHGVLHSFTGYLSALQVAADKQSEDLKTIAQTLHGRASVENNFSSVVDSLSAAIEPMKAIGELIPVLDRLAAVSEGQQSLSVHNKQKGEDSELAFAERMQQELQLKEEEYFKRLAEKEKELDILREELNTKHNDLLNECDELRLAVQEREQILQNREEELDAKSSELAEKDSENQQLKAQIEELKEKTKEMMLNLQRQLKEKQEEVIKKQHEETEKRQVEKTHSTAATLAAPSPATGFFDFVNSATAGNTLFNSEAPLLFSEEQENTEIVDFNSTQSEANLIAQESAIAASGQVASHAGAAGQSEAQSNKPGSFVSGVGSYGSGVRAQVFEVIVRQALAGTQWREICAVPMQSNNISPQEVEAEVKRRQALLNK